MRGRRWVLTAAMLVAGIRLWTQLRGKAKTPFGEWAIGWGTTFFFIALISEEFPEAAGALAGTLVVGDFLVNGSSLFKDLTGAVSGGAGFVDQPFAAPAATPTAARTSGQRGASIGTPTAAQVNEATGVGRFPLGAKVN